MSIKDPANIPLTKYLPYPTHVCYFMTLLLIVNLSSPGQWC